jgi:hypothetical protein
VTDIERWHPTGITDVDLAVAMWRPASMAPAQFKDPNGRVRVDDLGLAAAYAYVLEIPPIPNLPDLYVVKGRVGIMAALQRAMAAREGYDLDVVEATATRAVVRISRPPGPWHPVTVTMEQAERAGWTRRAKPDQPSNYELIPDRMLLARACTKAINMYAPGVLRGIAAAGAPVAPLADVDGGRDEPASGPVPDGEIGVENAGPEDNPC